jgi:stage V sporulation protein G
MATLVPAEPDTALLTFTVRNARPVSSKTLFALVDVELQLAGVGILIQGVQARRLATGGTSVHLPTCKDPDGIWRPAIVLPEEARGPLADAVLTFLVEEGLARPKFTPAVSPSEEAHERLCR